MDLFSSLKDHQKKTHDINSKFKPVKGYEGLYSVSKDGKIITESREYKMWNGAIRRTPRRYIKTDNRGTHRNTEYAVLSKNGIKKYYKVSEIVADAWLENPNNYKSVLHLDGDGTNNKVSNLKWVPDTL